jgi:hypothetical protein
LGRQIRLGPYAVIISARFHWNPTPPNRLLFCAPLGTVHLIFSSVGQFIILVSPFPIIGRGPEDEMAEVIQMDQARHARRSEISPATVIKIIDGRPVEFVDVDQMSPAERSQYFADQKSDAPKPRSPRRAGS